jgi:hypothetical protein
MDRRQAMTALGATVVGLTAAQTAGAEADAHGTTPLEQIHAYLCAFHLAKKNPGFYIEAHHYCGMVNESLHQCVIFDSSGKGARILGVEYIIPDKVYRGLPDAEKKYYHPHTYEVTSGLLIAPGMPKDDEKKFMGALLTTWGKCWHTWPDPKTPLPMGEPLLMWAATKDGQIPKEALDTRDKQFMVSTPDIRKLRANLGPVPQIDGPRSIDDLGRQWTNDGPDEPKKQN